MKDRGCLNCEVPTLWGFFCVDCVRAFVVGACGAIGAALVSRYVGGSQ